MRGPFGHRTAILATLLAALLGGAVACGDGDGGGETTATAVATTTAATTAAQTDRLAPLPDVGDYARSVAGPVDRLAASATALAGALAVADRSGGVAAVHRAAKRQTSVVQRARAELANMDPQPTRAAAAAHRRLLAATGHHRRYLQRLAAASAGAPTPARLTALGRARTEAAATLAAYRRFFAAAPAVSDRITAVGLGDTAPLNRAMSAAVAAAEQRASPAQGRGDPIAADGFSSPTGNLRCQLRADDLLCSSANDGFIVVLGATGGPVTARGSVAGGAVLPYGSAWSRGPFSCHSRTEGITCENATGNGFFLNRDSYNEF